MEKRNVKGQNKENNSTFVAFLLFTLFEFIFKPFGFFVFHAEKKIEMSKKKLYEEKCN